MTEENNNTGGQILAYIKCIELSVEEQKSAAEDIKEIKARAKGDGFDVKAINTLVKLRAMDKNTRDAEADILDCYKVAIGME